MKKLLLLPLLFLMACGATQNYTMQPDKPMPTLSEGMTKSQVNAKFGQPSKVRNHNKNVHDNTKPSFYRSVNVTEYCYYEYFNQRLNKRDSLSHFDLTLSFDDNKLTSWSKASCYVW